MYWIDDLVFWIVFCDCCDCFVDLFEVVIEVFVVVVGDENYVLCVVDEWELFVYLLY